MTLREQFLKHIKTAAKVEDIAPAVLNGVEVSWSNKLKAWKVDMTTSIPEFLKNNPDIAKNIKSKLPDLDFAKLSIRDILKRGVANEVLSELIKATDNTADKTAFIGQRILREGSMSTKAKNKMYEAFADSQIAKGSRRFLKAEGGGIIRKPMIKGATAGKIIAPNVARALAVSSVLTGEVLKAADAAVLTHSVNQFRKNPTLDSGVQVTLDAIGVNPEPVTSTVANVAGLGWANKDFINRALGNAKHPLQGFYE